MDIDETIDRAVVESVVSGRNADPFAVLGMHQGPDGSLVVRTFLPRAERVRVVDAQTDSVVADLPKLHEAGFFAGSLAGRSQHFHYRLLVSGPEDDAEIEDPYRFPPLLTRSEVERLVAGTDPEAFTKLGAHFTTIDGVAGVEFAVWAPNASRVSVIGSFNDWDGRRHPMRLRRECGVWEIFIPGIPETALYKYEIRTSSGGVLEKSDPFAFYCERPPNTASVVYDLDRYPWGDTDWMQNRSGLNNLDSPICIYEVHLGSWRRADGNRFLTYAELADELVPYVRDMGFTHIELMPVSEHPFDGSWGYQPIGLFAPTSRFGTPDDFRHFVDRCHAEGLGLIVDWVPGHFPSDRHGLGEFDGTYLYEHADPRKGRHMDWDTLIYNFGRNEVANFLISNAVFWAEKYHIDGLRVDAVASMLYLDYSRKEGEWIPNQFGGNENLEAIWFLKRMNEEVYARSPGITTVAEESTAWPMVSRPTYLGGLGFGYKWNMGWMHDTLEYIKEDPVHRRYHHDKLTFGLLYAFSENFILPLSHDEVVHGKGSLIGRMPGDQWQRFANLRAYFGFMYTHPGKKLLFMGGEFAQEGEWDHDRSLDWHLLEDPMHKGVQRLVADLNRLYRETPALHQLDCDHQGFEWIDGADTEQSVISYLRRGHIDGALAVTVCNFTPVVRHDYRIGVPEPGDYVVRLNTDAADYGGSGAGEFGVLAAEPVESHGRPCSLLLTLPPLATTVLLLAT